MKLGGETDYCSYSREKMDSSEGVTRSRIVFQLVQKKLTAILSNGIIMNIGSYQSRSLLISKLLISNKDFDLTNWNGLEKSMESLTLSFKI